MLLNHQRALLPLVLLLGLLAPPRAQAETLAGDSVLFTGQDTLDVIQLRQNGLPVLDSRSAGQCTPGNVVTGLNTTAGPTCQSVSATGLASYVVTTPNASVPNALVLGTSIIMRGLHSARPAAGVAGRLYTYTDAPVGMARDNGTTWDEFTLDWGQVANRTTLAHAVSHSPAGSDDLSGVYATKAYADAIAQGVFFKEQVRVTALTNITLAGLGTPIDGITLTDSQRVGVIGQTLGQNNGIYLAHSGAWTRALEADDVPAGEVAKGMAFCTQEGTNTQNHCYNLQTNNPITLGTTPLVFADFLPVGSVIPGAGLSSTGSTFNVGATAGGCITIGADDLGVSPNCLTDTQIVSMSASKLTTGTVPAARLPLPTTTTPGGVIAKDCLATPATPYIGGIDPSGTIQCVADVTAGGGTPTAVTLAALSGSSATATALIPANTYVVGVRAEVTTAVVGPSLFSVGVAEDLTRWGGAISGALSTVSDIADFRITTPQYYPTATDVIVTANGTPFSAGAIQLTIYYMTLTSLGLASGSGGGSQTAITVPSTATGTIAATNVQAALAELSTEKVETTDSRLPTANATAGLAVHSPTAGNPVITQTELTAGLAGVPGVSEVSDGVTPVPVTTAASLQFVSTDATVAIEVTEADAGPPQTLAVNLSVLASTQQDTLDSVFLRGNSISNPTSLLPFRIGSGTGLHSDTYVAGGILINELLDGAGNLVNQTFNVAAGNTWSYTTDSAPTYTLKGTEHEVEFAAGSRFTPPNGTGAPASTDCDAADEAGREYVQTDASDASMVWVCKGVSGWKQQTAGGGVSASSADTFTNKTLDAEGTGNVITLPRRLWLQAAGCNGTTPSAFWDLGGSPAVAACASPSTFTQKGVLDFANDGVHGAWTHLLLPATWTGAIDAKFVWYSSTTSNSVVWRLATGCFADGEVPDAALNPDNTVTDATKGTANQLNTATITGVSTIGCAAGELMHLWVGRDSNDAADTMAGTARLVGVELLIRETM